MTAPPTARRVRAAGGANLTRRPRCWSAPLATRAADWRSDGAGRAARPRFRDGGALWCIRRAETPRVGSIAPPHGGVQEET